MWVFFGFQIKNSNFKFAIPKQIMSSFTKYMVTFSLSKQFLISSGRTSYFANVSYPGFNSLGQNS